MRSLALPSPREMGGHTCRTALLLVQLPSGVRCVAEHMVQGGLRLHDELRPGHACVGGTNPRLRMPGGQLWPPNPGAPEGRRTVWEKSEVTRLCVRLWG